MHLYVADRHVRPSKTVQLYFRRGSSIACHRHAVPALFPRLHLYLHLPAVPVDVYVHPVLECLLISECVIREIRRKRRLSTCITDICNLNTLPCETLQLLS